MNTMICTRCYKEQDIIEFAPLREGGNTTKYCKTCKLLVNIYLKKYRTANNIKVVPKDPIQVKEYLKQYYINNKEKLKNRSLDRYKKKKQIIADFNENKVDP